MGFEVDNLTIVLLVVLAVLLIYQRFFGPQSLVPSLLLGIYRSWATGHGTPLQVRPANQLKTVIDAVKVPPPALRPGQAPKPLTQRWILDTPLTNEALEEIIRLVPLGLRALFPSLADTPAPIATLLPPSPTTALPLLLLSLSSQPRSPLVVLPHPRLLNAALSPKQGSHPRPALLVVHESIFAGVADQVFDVSGGPIGVLIVGDPERRHAAVAGKAAAAGVTVKWWEDIWDAGEAATAPVDEEIKFSDIHSYWYSVPEAGASIAPVYAATHMNMTAGIAGSLSLFPPDKRPSNVHNDVVASAERLDTPFGMSLALAAIWSGAGFRFIGPVATWDAPRKYEHELAQLAQPEQPMPTVLLLSPEHLTALLAALQPDFARHPFASLVAGHRLNSIRAGYVSKEGWIERLAPERSALGGLAGPRLRAVAVIGPTTEPIVALAPALLSMPISRVLGSPVSAGPIFASHFYDLQSTLVGKPFERVTPEGKRAHSGPPAANVEILLRGPGCEGVNAGPEGLEGPYTGEVFVRGPAVLAEDWADTGVEASVFPNGTFVLRE